MVHCLAFHLCLQRILPRDLLMVEKSDDGESSYWQLEAMQRSEEIQLLEGNRNIIILKSHKESYRRHPFAISKTWQVKKSFHFSIRLRQQPHPRNLVLLLQCLYQYYFMSLVHTPSEHRKNSGIRPCILRFMAHRYGCVVLIETAHRDWFSLYLFEFRLMHLFKK